MLKQQLDISFLKKAAREAVGIIRDDLEKLTRPLRLFPRTPAVKLKNNKGFQVLLTGGYGYGNVGDEAQLNANVLRWRGNRPEARITALSPHPDYTELHHGVHAENAPRVVWFNSNLRAYYWADNFIFTIRFTLLATRQLVGAWLLRAGLPPLIISAEEAHLLHILQRSDILHVSGGGFMTGMTRSRLWENSLLLKLAYILDTPAILTGQTIGVFKSATDRRLAKWGLRHSKAIYLRDKGGSETDLKKIGIEGPHVKSMYDDAMFCKKTTDEETCSVITNAELDPTKPFIAVNYHYWGMSAEMKERSIKRFVELCNYASNTFSLQILLLPMAPSDEIPLKTLRPQLTGTVGILSYGYDFRLARGAIAKAEWVFTMKHHPIIFAQGETVPVVSVCLDDYYYRKNKGAMANFGQEEYCLDKETFFSPNAEKKLLSLNKKGPFLRESMAQQLSKFQTLEDNLLPE